MITVWWIFNQANRCCPSSLLNLLWVWLVLSNKYPRSLWHTVTRRILVKFFKLTIESLNVFSRSPDEKGSILQEGDFWLTFYSGKLLWSTELTFTAWACACTRAGLRGRGALHKGLRITGLARTSGPSNKLSANRFCLSGCTGQHSTASCAHHGRQLNTKPSFRDSHWVTPSSEHPTALPGLARPGLQILTTELLLLLL